LRGAASGFGEFIILIDVVLVYRLQGAMNNWQ